MRLNNTCLFLQSILLRWRLYSPASVYSGSLPLPYRNDRKKSAPIKFSVHPPEARGHPIGFRLHQNFIARPNGCNSFFAVDDAPLAGWFRLTCADGCGCFCDQRWWYFLITVARIVVFLFFIYRYFTGNFTVKTLDVFSVCIFNFTIRQVLAQV